MSYLKTIAAGAALFIVMSAQAQHPGAPASAQSTEAMQARVMAADEHLQALLTKLSLTADQQSRVIRVLYELQDETMRIVENEKLSRDEQRTQIKALRSMAHTHIYASLNDEQKNTLDEFMRAPHE